MDLQDKNGLSPLHYAASHSDVLLEISKNLIEIGADENKRAKIKSSLLMIACKYSCLNAVHFLIECGANVAVNDEDGYTALHHACNSHYLKCLIQSGADVNPLNAVTFLTEHGANMALKDSDGYIALHHASNSHYSHEILKCLIQSGADVNECTKTKSTPLMMACKCGLLNAVTFLTEHGANMALKDSDGYTALHHTCNSHSHHSITLLSYLIENGADINDCTNDDYTPLMVAAQKGDINAVASLVECGANVHHRDRDGRTAPHFAIYYISPASIVEVSSSLVKYGATPTICNETLQMLGRCDGHENVATFLIEHGADVDLQDKDGDTALYYAASSSLPEIVKTFLNLGASHMCNHQGLTPLHQACISANIAVVEYLIQRPEITREQRVDALELLGASRATQYKEFSLLSFFVAEGLMYIKRGMEERFVDPSQPILKQPKKPAYGNRKESQTPEELAQIEGDTEAILMESLLIKERILGTNHSELLRSIRFVCSSCNLTDPSLLIALYSRAVDIAQKSNLSARDDF